MEYVARVLAQIPPPRKHLVKYHGRYSDAARGIRRRDQITLVHSDPTQPQTAPPAANAAVRKRWADLLRRIYEVGPQAHPRAAATSVAAAAQAASCTPNPYAIRVAVTLGKVVGRGLATCASARPVTPPRAPQIPRTCPAWPRSADRRRGSPSRSRAPGNRGPDHDVARPTCA